MQSNIKHIILSGGWGYGNLGDDAILLSSYQLLKLKYPGCHITVLSYNVSESSSLIPSGNNVSYLDSLHVSIFGYHPKKMTFGNGIISDIIRPFKSRIERRIKPHKNSLLRSRMLKDTDKFLSRYKDVIEPYSNLCRTADLYIMSGGGYLTNWAEMGISKYYELDIAKRNGLKTYIIGQTIGPFKRNAWKLIEKIFSKTDGSFFRDKESIKDAVKLGANCLENVVPDLVLSTERSTQKGNYIVLVPFLSDLTKNKSKIVDNLASIAAKYNYSVYITVSQLWPYGMQVGLSIYFELLANKIKAKLIVLIKHFQIKSFALKYHFQIRYGVQRAEIRCFPLIKVQLLQICTGFQGVYICDIIFAQIQYCQVFQRG